MNTDALRKRLQHVLDERGLSMRQVSMAAGLGPAAVRNLLIGRTQNVSEQALDKILQAIAMTKDEFFQRESATHELAAAAYSVPICGTIPAGNPTWTEGVVQALDSVPGDEHDRRYGAFALRVSGNSMAPRYVANDILVLRPLQIHLPIKDPKNPVPRATFDALVGRCVAVLLNGEATLKKLDIEHLKGGDYFLHLRPINPDYPVITVQEKDEAQFQGEVYKLIREE